MKIAKTIAPALMLAALVSAPAFAETTAAPAEKAPREARVHPADTDKDGTLSRAEFNTFNEKRFAEMDKNSDGQITTDEMKAHMQAKREHFKTMRGEKTNHGGRHEVTPVAPVTE